MSAVSDQLAERAARLAAAADDIERLRLIRVEIGETEADLGRLGQERQKLAVPVLAGDKAAIAIRATIDDDIGLLGIRLADLRAALAQAEADQRTAALAEHAEMQAANRRRTAAGRATMAHAAAEIVAACETAGELMRTARTALFDLAAASNSAQVKRFADRWPEVLRNALAAAFRINPEGQPRADNNFLGLVPEWGGELGRRPLGRLIEEMLDDAAALFEDQAAAEECRARLAKHRMPAIVLQLGDGLRLVVPALQAFATAAEAQTALASVAGFRHEPHRIVEYQGAFIVLRADLADAVTAPAAEAA